MQRLAHLRAIVGGIQPGPAREKFPFSELVQGIRRGGLTEISGTPGSGKTETVLRFLAEHPELRVAWLEDSLTVYPCAFPQHRVELSRVLFADAGKDLLWSAQQVLRSGLFGVVVVASAEGFSEIDLRRLQLGAEKAQAAVILLVERPAERGTWALSLQVQATRRKDRPLRVIRGKA